MSAQAQGRDVIVIGGSAGAVEATRAIVRGLPADLPAAVAAVVQIWAGIGAVRLRRLTWHEFVAMGGGALLVVGLFLPWYHAEERATVGALATRGVNLTFLHAMWTDEQRVIFAPPFGPRSTFWSEMRPMDDWIGRVDFLDRACGLVVEVDHDGFPLRIDRAVCEPKPVQQPGPPIWVGSHGGPRATARIGAADRGGQASHRATAAATAQTKAIEDHSHAHPCRGRHSPLRPGTQDRPILPTSRARPPRGGTCGGGSRSSPGRRSRRPPR